MAKQSVTVKNQEEFQKFLVHYIDDGNTNKHARWLGVFQDDYFKIQQSKCTSNFSRCQIIGFYSNEHCLNLQLSMPTRVRDVSVVLVFLCAVIGLISVNLNLVIVSPLVGAVFYGIGYMLFRKEKEEALIELELLSEVAACETYY